MTKLPRVPACMLLVCLLPLAHGMDRMRAPLRLTTVEGKIIDIGEFSLTVSPPFNATRTFHIDAGTQIKVGQEIADRSSLAKGQRVRVIYDRRSRVALTVTVLPDPEAEDQTESDLKP